MSSALHRGSVALLLASLALPGCGGLGEVGRLWLLDSAPELDGAVWSTGAVTIAGGRPQTGDADALVPGSHARQFFSFDLAGVPSGIESARLELDQVVVRGTPYAGLGRLILEVVNYGASLDAGDFGLPALGPSVVVASDPSLGVKQVDVTALVDAALRAGRTRFQVRLRFDVRDTDTDGVSDAVEIGDAERSTPTAEAPVLVISRPN